MYVYMCVWYLHFYPLLLICVQFGGTQLHHAALFRSVWHSALDILWCLSIPTPEEGLEPSLPPLLSVIQLSSSPECESLVLNKQASASLYPVPGFVGISASEPLMWTRGDLLKHLLSLTGIRADTFLAPALRSSHRPAHNHSLSKWPLTGQVKHSLSQNKHSFREQTTS